MKSVFINIRKGWNIEAIKEFRALYGCGLKEAKDAVDAIRDEMKIVPVKEPSQYLVLTRNSQWDEEYELIECRGKDDAIAVANGRVATSQKTYVVAVVSESFEVTTRTLKDAA